MQEQKQHDGAQPGSGRPAGSSNLGTKALSEGLIEDGKCPVAALVRLAEQAEAEGRITVAIDAWKAVLPYVHARPRNIEINRREAEISWPELLRRADSEAAALEGTCREVKEDG
jgi:galactose-1-phosphate uridylyltransferase